MVVVWNDFVWSERDPTLLNVVLDQKRRLICWAISTIRHLESLFRLNGIAVSLSVQELLDTIPRNLIYPRTGELLNMDGLGEFLLANGTIAEEDCPFTGVVRRRARPLTEGVARYLPTKLVRIDYNNLSDEMFDDRLRETLERSPVAARIIVAPGFDAIQGYQIYQPEEVNVSVGNGHLLLVEGCGREEDQRYWQAQDSFGMAQGQNGHIRFARFDDIVTDFYMMSVDD